MIIEWIIKAYKISFNKDIDYLSNLVTLFAAVYGRGNKVIRLVSKDGDQFATKVKLSKKKKGGDFGEATNAKHSDKNNQ